MPVAWRGEVGVYVGEDGHQLRIRVGEGITGWVAVHGEPQYLPDAARDPRAATIPGTEDELDESMLLAPMHYEDRTVGVIVLSKLGLDQFAPHDLRYLGIYASIAGQALVNAEISERLHAHEEALRRQGDSQRELLRVTESILSNLDPAAVVEEIATSIGAIIGVDTLAIYVHEPVAPAARRCSRAARAPGSSRAASPTPEGEARCPVDGRRERAERGPEPAVAPPRAAAREGPRARRPAPRADRSRSAGSCSARSTSCGSSRPTSRSR